MYHCTMRTFVGIKSKIIHFSLQAKKSENNETVISKPINSKAAKNGIGFTRTMLIV